MRDDCGMLPGVQSCQKSGAGNINLGAQSGYRSEATVGGCTVSHVHTLQDCVCQDLAQHLARRRRSNTANKLLKAGDSLVPFLLF